MNRSEAQKKIDRRIWVAIIIVTVLSAWSGYNSSDGWVQMHDGWR